MEALKLLLSLCILGAMIVLCVLRLDMAGYGGLAGGALGFIGWFLTGGHSSMGERLGNGYIGAFVGTCLGFLCGGAVMILLQKLAAS